MFSGTIKCFLVLIVAQLSVFSSRYWYNYVFFRVVTGTIKCLGGLFLFQQRAILYCFDRSIMDLVMLLSYSFIEIY